MRRAALLAVALLLLVALAAAVSLEPPEAIGLPAGAQSLVTQYLAASFPPETMSVQYIERAAEPWSFERSMSRATYGDSLRFQVDLGPTHTGQGNLAPLPFPPRELWCVLLERNGPGSPSAIVLLVGQHSDLYNAEWLLHQVPADPPAPQAGDILAAVGCRRTLHRSERGIAYD